MDSHVLWAVDNVCRLINANWFLHAQIALLISRGDVQRRWAWRYHMWHWLFRVTGGKYAWRRVYWWRADVPLLVHRII